MEFRFGKEGFWNVLEKLHFEGYVDIRTLLKSVILKIRKQVLFWQKVMSGEWESDIFVRNRTRWWFVSQRISFSSLIIFYRAPLSSQVHFCVMSLFKNRILWKMGINGQNGPFKGLTYGLLFHQWAQNYEGSFLFPSENSRDEALFFVLLLLFFLFFFF